MLRSVGLRCVALRCAALCCVVLRWVCMVHEGVVNTCLCLRVSACVCVCLRVSACICVLLRAAACVVALALLRLSAARDVHDVAGEHCGCDVLACMKGYSPTSLDMNWPSVPALPL